MQPIALGLIGTLLAQILLTCAFPINLLSLQFQPFLSHFRENVQQTITNQLTGSRDSLTLAPEKTEYTGQPINSIKSKRPLRGKFLHITDIHPDPYYLPHKNIDDEDLCHFGEGSSGEFGTPLSSCDSPFSLVNGTFDWIKENLADEIDFIIWTGDNARHDNDRRLPRNEQQIIELNRFVASKFLETFADPVSGLLDIPIIPNIGNNDVFPHNVMRNGPSKLTRQLYAVWNKFLPQDEFHIFEIGGYFISEVVPNRLAVISLNTLFFYRQNPFVDNCNGPSEPGRKQLEWLGLTLAELRSRGMKAWIIGHVPPVEKNYENSCLRKYTLWMTEFSDVVVGSVFGHMNVDHFVPLDGLEAYKQAVGGGISAPPDDDDGDDNDDDDDDGEEEDNETKIDNNEEEVFGNKNSLVLKPLQAKVDYFEDLRSSFQGIHKLEQLAPKGSQYSVTIVSPSVVPNFYPTMRVYEYNTTGTDTLQTSSSKPWADTYIALQKQKKKKKSKKRDISLPVLRKLNETFGVNGLGPGYVEQTFTPTKFTQYYANLTGGVQYEIEYASDDFPYNMRSLIAEEWVDLAQRLSSDSDLWKVFVRRAFVSTGFEQSSSFLSDSPPSSIV